VSILYFVLENPTSPTSFELLRDAVEGKEVLAYFAKRSLAADRCSIALEGMFKRLPESIRQGGDVIASKKRRQGSSPQSSGPRPTFSSQNEAAGPRRASTYPDTIPNLKTAGHGPSHPSPHNQFAGIGSSSSYPTHSISNPNLFDGVPDLTPASSNDSLPSFGIAPIHDPQQSSVYNPSVLSSSFADPSGMNVPIADISTMMFPSTDPLAYPNQPMTAFENRRPQASDRNSAPPVSNGHPLQIPTSVDMKGHPPMFAPTSMPNGQGRLQSDNEAQLFGPVPMYLMQGTQQYRAFSPQLGMQMPGPNNVQFDELLSQGDWSQSFMDPALNMGTGRPPHQQFIPHGWR
jgi:hypothetical protein